NSQSDSFTTVSCWDSADWLLEHGTLYENTKRLAFLEFADLPRLTGQPLELALFLRTERDMLERRDLEKRGWRVRHSREVAATPHSMPLAVPPSLSVAFASIRQRPPWSRETLPPLVAGAPKIQGKITGHRHWLGRYNLCPSRIRRLLSGSSNPSLAGSP